MRGLAKDSIAFVFGCVCVWGLFSTPHSAVLLFQSPSSTDGRRLRSMNNSLGEAAPVETSTTTSKDFKRSLQMLMHAAPLSHSPPLRPFRRQTPAWSKIIVLENSPIAR
ncbi:hypothetical protein EJ04DRAFT_509204 [Polyplosphaeria fusca]|uniref:Uncharacterized protein n=1 Tax=Polyplosphaeria fusca TaxID=682080 RepID=A0A9P4V827_9PLEO|nr:hypothetical protein EJ04DRAFT_509204 [Polyplosphaeria fusca]